MVLQDAVRRNIQIRQALDVRRFAAPLGCLLHSMLTYAVTLIAVNNQLLVGEASIAVCCILAKDAADSRAACNMGTARAASEGHRKGQHQQRIGLVGLHKHRRMCSLTTRGEMRRRAKPT